MDLGIRGYVSLSLSCLYVWYCSCATVRGSIRQASLPCCVGAVGRMSGRSHEGLEGLAEEGWGGGGLS